MSDSFMASRDIVGVVLLITIMCVGIGIVIYDIYKEDKEKREIEKNVDWTAWL